MSTTKLYRVSRFVMDSGERCCLIIDGSPGLPLYYMNLYLTTQLRGKSLSSSTIMSQASHLSVLQRFFDSRNIDIEKKIINREFFSTFEVDALKDFSQRKHPRKKESGGVSILFDEEELFEYVSFETVYSRITTFHYYLVWLAGQLIASPSQDDKVKIDLMGNMIKSRRPDNKRRNGSGVDRSLNEKQISELWEVVFPESDRNPFSESVRLRNYLIVLFLYHLGIRGGELLNIRVSDIDFSGNTVFIARRADEKEDPRSVEPNVKTLDRRLPMGETLVSVLYGYIIKSRRMVCKGRRHDFLFVTHKAGPSQGLPMTIGAYHKVMRGIQSSGRSLSYVTGHMLRHTWNYRFSELRDQSPDAERDFPKEELERSTLMGWKPGSGTAARYNNRFVERKANKAGLQLQKSNGTRLPRNFKNGD